MIIVFLNQKGGTDKTTLSINVAHALSTRKKNNKVLLVDADPQGADRDWAAARDVNDALVDYEYPTFKISIQQRVIFAECAAPSSIVIEMENKGQAAKEIKKLANEILGMN